MNLKKVPFIYLFTLSPYIGIILGIYIFRNAFVAMFIYHLGMLAALMIYKKNIDSVHLFKIHKPIIIIITSFLCLLSGVIFYALWGYVKIPDIHISDALSKFGLSGTAIWVFLIYFSTINPFLEELFWRGLLKSNTIYFSVADVLFGCFHFLVLIQFIQVEYAVLTTGGLIIISRVWRYLYDVLKERLAVIISHAVADVSIILSAIFLMNG